MFRRIGNILVNLEKITTIELTFKTIHYTIQGQRHLYFFGVGGSDNIVIKEEHFNEKDAKDVFEALHNKLGNGNNIFKRELQ